MNQYKKEQQTKKIEKHQKTVGDSYIYRRLGSWTVVFIQKHHSWVAESENNGKQRRMGTKG